MPENLELSTIILTIKLMMVGEEYFQDVNVIYFSSMEKADEAIEQFKDELLWYFTEYVQRLDEAQNG